MFIISQKSLSYCKNFFFLSIGQYFWMLFWRWTLFVLCRTKTPSAHIWWLCLVIWRCNAESNYVSHDDWILFLCDHLSLFWRLLVIRLQVPRWHSVWWRRSWGQIRCSAGSALLWVIESSLFEPKKWQTCQQTLA